MKCLAIQIFFWNINFYNFLTLRKMKNRAIIILLIGALAFLVALCIFFGSGYYQAGCYNDEVSKKIEQFIQKSNVKVDSFKDATYLHVIYEDGQASSQQAGTQGGLKFKITTGQHDSVAKALENEPSTNPLTHMASEQNIVNDGQSNPTDYKNFDTSKMFVPEDTSFMADVGFLFLTNITESYSTLSKSVKELAAKVEKDKPTLFGLLHADDIVFFFHTDKKDGNKKLSEISTTEEKKVTFNKKLLSREKMLALMFSGQVPAASN